MAAHHAHRRAPPPTVKDADRILFMDQGRVSATGAHAELMREQGLYARSRRSVSRRSIYGP